MTADPVLVILDCDGVVVDTERLVQEVDLAMIADLGWPITRAEIHEQHLGRSTADVAANVARKIGRPLPERWLETRRAGYRQAFVERLQPVPGFEDALAELTAAGLPTCIASSGTHDAIRFSLGLTGLFDRFAGRIFSSQDVTHGKPAPDLFLLAAREMGAAPRDCVVVEDSPSGVAGARAAGMPVVGYAGLTPASLLGEADVVIDDMGGLLDAVRRAAGHAGADGRRRTRRAGPDRA